MIKHPLKVNNPLSSILHQFNFKFQKIIESTTISNFSKFFKLQTFIFKMNVYSKLNDHQKSINELLIRNVFFKYLLSDNIFKFNHNSQKNLLFQNENLL